MIRQQIKASYYWVLEIFFPHMTVYENSCYNVKTFLFRYFSPNGLKRE